MDIIEGTAKINGIASSCNLFLYTVDDGEVIAVTTSDPITGYYTFPDFPAQVNLAVVASPLPENGGIVPSITNVFKVDGLSPSYLASGYLFITYSTSGARYFPYLDKTATDDPNWDLNFKDTLTLPNADDRLRYTTGNGGQSSLPYLVSVYEGFNKGWTLSFSASKGTWSGDLCDGDFEFLDSDGNTLAAIRLRKYGTYSHRMYYGRNLSNLTAAATSGSHPNSNGELTFSDTQVIYTNTRGSNYNASWVLGSVDVNSIVAIRSNAMSKSTYTSGAGGGAGSIIKVISLSG